MVIKFSSYIVEFIIRLVGVITETQREAFRSSLEVSDLKTVFYFEE